MAASIITGRLTFPWDYILTEIKLIILSALGELKYSGFGRGLEGFFKNVQLFLLQYIIGWLNKDFEK